MRTPKKPLSAWIVANREAQPTEDGKGWTSGELARRLGVSDSTVRGWEAGRSVSEPNLKLLERLFRVTAPGHDEPSTNIDRLAAVLEEQNRLLVTVLALLSEEREMRPATRAAVDAMLASLPKAATRSHNPTDALPAGPAR